MSDRTQTKCESLRESDDLVGDRGRNGVIENVDVFTSERCE